MPEKSHANHPDTSVAQNIARNSTTVLLCQVVCQACVFLTTCVLARYLQPRMFGLLTFAFTYVSFFEVPAMLGTNAIITREMSHLTGTEAAAFWRSALVLRSILFTASLVGALSVACICFRADPVALPIVLWACLGLVTSLRAAYIARLRAQLRAGWSARVTLGRTLVYCALALFVVTVSRGSVINIIQGSLLATLLALLVERSLVRRFILPDARAVRGRMGSILRESWPLAMSSVLTIIQVRIDVVMLRALGGDASVGIYGVALKPAEAAYVVSAALGVSAFPLLVQAYRNNARQFDVLCRELFLLLLLLGIPFAVVLGPLAERIIPSLFGGSYSRAGQVLAILCLHIPLGYLNMLLVNILICARRQRLELWVSILTTATNVAANAILIPKYGVMGAAIATLLCQCTALGALAGMVYHAARFSVPWRRALAGVMIAGCSLALVLWVRGWTHWLVAGGIAGGFYLAACFLIVYRRRWQTIIALLIRREHE